MQLFILFNKNGTPIDLRSTKIQMLIRAEDEQDARETAADRAGFEGPEVWRSPRKSTCVLVDPCGTSGVLMTARSETPFKNSP